MMHNPELLPIFVMVGIALLAFLAYAIQLARFHWLAFEELPDKEQQRLLDEASSKTYVIGGIAVHPDARGMRYYTTTNKR